MSAIIDKCSKVIVKNKKGKYTKAPIYIKTKEEVEIWERLKGYTLDAIAEISGINRTRVFRMRAQGGMKLIERDLILEIFNK